MAFMRMNALSALLTIQKIALAHLKRISNELIAIKFISKVFYIDQSIHFRLYINHSFRLTLIYFLFKKREKK